MVLAINLLSHTTTYDMRVQTKNKKSVDPNMNPIASLSPLKFPCSAIGFYAHTPLSPLSVTTRH